MNRTKNLLPLLRSSLAIVVALTVGMSSASAENWPQWRGQHNNGISAEKGIPTQWSQDQNVAWRLELPGPAGATPAVWENRIFLTTVEGDDLDLLCVSTEGKLLWRQTIGHGDKVVRDGEGNAASPSPTTDGQHVWSMMANGAIGCYTVDGKEVWKMNLQDRYGPFEIQFGMTSTPVLHGDHLYLQLVHGDGDAKTHEALVVALDKLTGEEVWKQGRVTQAHTENEHSYASPILYNDGQLKCLVTHGADYAIAYRLNDGQELWRLGGLNPQDDPNRRYHPFLRFVASPAAVPGMIIIPTAKNGPVVAIRPDGHGDVTGQDSVQYWVRDKNTPDVPSPLIHDGLVYLCRENGDLLCLEAKTGKELYLKRTHRQRHRASPVYADGKIYLCARDGIVSVIKAGREFEMLDQNDMGETISASPAISNGTMYIRTFESLWAIRKISE